MAGQPAIPEGFIVVDPSTFSGGRPGDSLTSGSGTPTQWNKGPIGVDDPAQSASFWTTIKASLQPNVTKQIEQYATDRGIDIGRYGVDKDGNVVYLNDKGQVVRELPSVAGATGIWDFFQRLGQYIGSSLGPTAPEAVGTAAAWAMPHPALKVPAAALAAGATDVVRQGLGNVMLDKSPMEDIDYLNAAGQGALTATGVGGAQLASKLIRRSPYDISPFEAQSMRAQGDPAEWARREALAAEAGVTMTPSNITGLRSMRDLERQMGRETEATDPLNELYRRREQIQVPAFFEKQMGEISPPYPRGLAQREMGTASQDIIDRAKAQRTAASSADYEEAFNSGVKLDAATVTADLAARIKQTPLNSGHRKSLNRIMNMLAPEKTIGEGKLQKTVRVAENDYRRLHGVKLAIDEELEAIEAGAPAAVRAAGRDLEEIQNALTVKLRQSHPGYEKGYQTFIAMSGPVDEATKGIVGAAAREKSAGFQLTPNKYFAFNSADTESIKSTRDQFVSAGKLKEWDQGLRAYIEETSDKYASNFFSSKGFYKAMSDPRAQKNMRAAMTDQQWSAWSDYMEVLGMAADVPVEGPATATDIGGRARFRKPLGKLISAAAQVLSPQDIGNAIQGRALSWSEGQGVREMAEVFMSPGAMKELKKLRLMPKGGENAMMVVFNLLNRAGANVITQPNERPIPALGN